MMISISVKSKNFLFAGLNEDIYSHDILCLIPGRCGVGGNLGRSVHLSGVGVVVGPHNSYSPALLDFHLLESCDNARLYGWYWKALKRVRDGAIFS